jgi:cell division control protein 12
MISVKPLDVEMMKRLGTRVNLIPVIAKADTMTQEDLHNFKYIVRTLSLWLRLELTYRSEKSLLLRTSRSTAHPLIPRSLLLRNMPLLCTMSCLSPLLEVPTTLPLPMGERSKDENTSGVLPRVSHLSTSDTSASWQTVENEDHCDFKKLRSLLIRTYMLDLITSTEETHYESYRLAQMETRKFGEPKVKKVDNPKFKEEEEMLRKRFTEQVKLEESRFRQWEQHVSSFVHFNPGKS